MNESKAITLVQGWSVMMDDDEPRILDEELGVRLGFTRPRKIRQLIESLLRTGFLNSSEVRTHSVQTSKRGGRPGKRHYLTKIATLLVIVRSNAKIAPVVTRQVVQVFAFTSGHFVPRWIAVPVPQNTPTLGDLHGPEIKRRCRDVAVHFGTTTHQVQGWLRTPYSASGVYRINAAHYTPVVKRIERWLKGTELPPSQPRRLLRAAVPAQRDLPFPKTVQ